MAKQVEGRIRANSALCLDLQDMNFGDLERHWGGGGEAMDTDENCDISTPPRRKNYKKSPPSHPPSKQNCLKHPLPPRSRTFHTQHKSQPPITLFVGSWNCEYQDFPLNVIIPTDEDAQTIEKKLAHVSSRPPPLKGFTPSFNAPNFSHESEPEARPGFLRQSTLTLTKVTPAHQPLSDWIEPGAHIYIISLQEVTSDDLYTAISVYLNAQNGPHQFKRIHFPEYKISGRGDGALLSNKHTSMACWVREDLLGRDGPVVPQYSKGISFSNLNGSKGAVAFCLTILKQHVCFVGCHMPAGGASDRRAAREYIVTKLGEVFSGHENVESPDVFHHIVWAGDFNFRLHGIAAADALDLIQADKIEELFKYDERTYLQFGDDFNAILMEEPPITFYPTYKKKDGRKPLDRSKPDWAADEYQTRYVVKWYKGGHEEDRVPAWTDRIFKWSMAELHNCLEPLPDSYDSVNPVFQNVLLASDHSPVKCNFNLFPLDPRYAMPHCLIRLSYPQV